MGLNEHDVRAAIKYGKAQGWLEDAKFGHTKGWLSITPLGQRRGEIGAAATSHPRLQRKAERRRGLHRQRERERREMLHLKRIADHRNDAVMRILIKDGPMKLPKLTKRAGRCRAFEGAQGYVLRELVRRVVKRLTAWGHADMTAAKERVWTGLCGAFAACKAHEKCCS
jgi:hypothetical protein